MASDTTPDTSPDTSPEDVPQPNSDDPWPRYAIFAEALVLDRQAAEIYGVEGKPTHAWSREEILLVALETLRHRAHEKRSKQT